MATHQDLFFPAVESIATNNIATNTVIFQDLNSDRFLAVIPKTWTDNTSGQVRYVFELWYQTQNTLSYTPYLFPRASTQGVDVFLNIVNAQTLNNNLTQYNNWFQINRREIGTTRNILLNDTYVENRTFVPANGTTVPEGGYTNLYLCVNQALDPEIFACYGNYSKSWAYFYAY